jgi:hypothetical protein
MITQLAAVTKTTSETLLGLLARANIDFLLLVALRLIQHMTRDILDTLKTTARAMDPQLNTDKSHKTLRLIPLELTIAIRMETMVSHEVVYD